MKTSSKNKTLSQNEAILKNEITTQEKRLNYCQKSTAPHSTKTLQILDKILLLRQLQNTSLKNTSNNFYSK